MLTPLVIEDLGRADYGSALEVQRARLDAVLGARDNGAPMAGYLLFVEHTPPVITITRRPDAPRHLLASPGALRGAGIEVAETDRGGDITYHGPGQQVVYPILDLNALGLNLHAYIRLLEEAAIAVCARFGLPARREPGATGVWVGPGEGAKVCAIGVRVRRWASLHGLALNVRTDLSHFDLIVPCGLAGRRVTSLERELGPACPEMASVRAAFAEFFGRAVGDCALRARAGRVHRGGAESAEV
ncbi:MAG TPA: lipoyl(octanoyl) transferase [Phycisphaerales bacterium]|nr:lipoyl(octanoyl) transferase [Phycisphaerales bacterium]